MSDVPTSSIFWGFDFLLGPSHTAHICTCCGVSVNMPNRNFSELSDRARKRFLKCTYLKSNGVHGSNASESHKLTHNVL